MKETKAVLEDAGFEKCVFGYLDALRETGVVNMYGAGPYIRREFGVDKAASHKLLAGWMKTFGERHVKNGEKEGGDDHEGAARTTPPSL